jgi:3alpha(or 20beta)-hydroxysteroid dehydrogenase
VARARDKVALITGGATGLGLAQAKLMAQEGATVYITDIDEAEGKLAAEQSGLDLRFLAHDVTDLQRWLEIVDIIETAAGPLSILVNNAGIWSVASIEDTTEADFRRIVDINQVGTFLGTKAAVPSMRAGGGGSIVNISSRAGLEGLPNMCAYVASKWAITGMSKSAAVELGPFGIRVNSVHPGLVETRMTAGTSPSKDQPIGRKGTPEDVAYTVLFLASDESSYTTGGAFTVDGGSTAVPLLVRPSGE